MKLLAAAFAIVLGAGCASSPSDGAGTARVVIEGTDQMIELDQLEVIERGGCDDAPGLVRWSSLDGDTFELRLPLVEGTFELCCIPGFCASTDMLAGVDFELAGMSSPPRNCPIPVGHPDCAGSAIVSADIARGSGSIQITGARIPLDYRRRDSPIAIVDAHASIGE